MERIYYPSFAELIDRLSIVIQKEMFSSDDEMRKEFILERNLIINDINTFISEGVVFDGASIFAAMLLQLINSHIWENEKVERGQSPDINTDWKEKYLSLIKSHKLNSDRANVKKKLQQLSGGRIDHKLNYNLGLWPIPF